MAALHEAGRTVRVRSWRQTARVLLVSAAVAAAAVLAAALWLRG